MSQEDKAVAIDYTPGDWFKARSIDEMQAFYLSRLYAIRSAARECGYAIGVHGSMRRDFDLMAMQWRGDCTDQDTLAKAIQFAACGIRAETVTWEQKPNGRIATSLCICWTDHSEQFSGMLSVGHIDLSVIAKRQPVAAQEPVGEISEAAPEGMKGSFPYAHFEEGMPPVGTKLYDHAAPCARCAEAERTEAIATKKLGEEIIKTGALQSKLTERDEEIRTIRANLAQLEKDFDRRNERIEALEAYNATRTGELAASVKQCAQQLDRIKALEAEVERLTPNPSRNS